MPDTPQSGTTIARPARAAGKSFRTRLHLAMAGERGERIVDARDLPPASPRPKHDCIASVAENEADI